ncbi:MAG: SDR family oxidoreductase [bacterium]|nr:SDR family oxidoreductase [bacterium]
MPDLSGRVALVTGGGSGIGLGCAQAFADAGARVALMGRDEGRLAGAVAALGAERAAAFAGDVGVEADVERVVGEVVARFGRLDVALNAAGTGSLAPVTTHPADEWARVMRTNLDGTFHCVKHQGAAMVAGGRGGSIVNVSSIAGALTHRLMSAYCVSKAGLEMLTRCAADELGEHGVRVNAIRPGLVPTDLATPLTSVPAVVENYRDLMPLRRLGSAWDIGRAALYLASDDAGWVTGQVLSVDGGHTLRMGPDVALMFR